MGYTTEFTGEFKLNKKLDKETHEFLVKFNETRRMARNLDPKYGVEGEFFVGGKGYMGHDEDDTVIDSNRPPKTQPSLWCQWRPNEDGTAIEWDDVEKFYYYVEWIEYLIETIFKPREYSLTGNVRWSGEEFMDIGTIVIKDNDVQVIHGQYV